MAQKDLKDLLPYVPEEYLTSDEKAWIRSTFKGNDKIKILRKILLPSAYDPELPIEQIVGDVWIRDFDFTTMQSDEIKPLVLGRQYAIKYIFDALVTLKSYAEFVEENPEDKALRIEKDSTK